ncbi:MAG: SusF/SusE family outer membrane protein [Bacteroidales bacterium]
MNKKIYLLLAFVGLVGFFSSCEKDEDKVKMSIDPTVPTIKTMPDLTLIRENGTNTIEFAGTLVDPGFNASATYFLEVTTTSDISFEDALILYSGVQDTLIQFTVSELNTLLLKKFPEDQLSSANFRIRAQLTVDAGTGVWGTSTNPMEYYSPTTNANITIYGLPRLDLLNSGKTQKVESALGNGIYTGYVKLDKTKAFTLYDPDNDVTYGGVGGTLSVNGAGIIPDDNGYYQLNVDVNALTYSTSAYMIGLVGSATPNGWDTPDQKMDYNSSTGTWSITVDLVVGEIKFRKNDGWSWNLGGTADKLVHNGDNIAISAAGNYTITLTITNDTQGSEAGSCKIVKN